MKLIIVESPTKAKTISKFLDKGFVTSSSFGHIRDLPEKEMAVDIANNFQPKYVIPLKAKKRVNELKKLANKAEQIILATDEDREGEAIAWHLTEALKLDPKKTVRIAFHEITKEAILEALSKPKQIDQQLVDAQQARRILDRLVGYELSPFLYKKVAKGLSAGRVQSVAVRLVVEREREIENFQSQEYWSVTASLEKGKEKIKAELNKINKKAIGKLKLEAKVADQAASDLKDNQGIITNIEEKVNLKNPLPPFTTSTLQQTANRQLGYSAKQTMMLAQKLYEEGFITYMRTDSVSLSIKFLEESKQWLKNQLGEKYTLSSPRQFKNKSKNAQEAHEAIRPTQAKQTPDNLLKKLESKTGRLYQLIWQRAIASQMPAAKLAMSALDCEVEKNKTVYGLRATGQKLIFDGYLAIYPENTSEQILPAWKLKDTVNLKQVEANQHFTKAPARYSDAGLVKELEKHGIGRPSTYAPTIATVIARNYVERDQDKRLAPSPIALVVTDLLVNHFSHIIDYHFTAELENNLDEIAEGKKNWVPVITDFYQPFHQNLEIKYKELQKTDIIPEEKSEEKCDKCDAPMVIKTGRFGKFLACSAYPDCRNIKKLTNSNQETDPELKILEEKHIDEVCDKCQSKMTVKKGRFGYFLACSAFPKCKNIKGLDESADAIDCPVCKQGKIVKKVSRRGVFYACNRYPKCKTAYSSKPTGNFCPDCGQAMITDKGQEVCSNKSCEQ